MSSVFIDFWVTTRQNKTWIILLIRSGSFFLIETIRHYPSVFKINSFWMLLVPNFSPTTAATLYLFFTSCHSRGVARANFRKFITRLFIDVENWHYAKNHFCDALLHLKNRDDRISGTRDRGHQRSYDFYVYVYGLYFRWY